MPPKAAAKKDDVDLADLGSLPEANVAVVQILFSQFRTAETRTAVKDFVGKQLAESERVKQLTRAEILEYGKAKGIINEDEALKEGQPSREGALTIEQMHGQAASDRIFELVASFRKQKKERQLSAGEEWDETDNMLADGLILMPDFPSTPKEALALSQYGQSVHCQFEIYQVNENLDNSETTPQEVDLSEDQTEREHALRIKSQIQAVKQAQSLSAKNAPLRQMASVRVAFSNADVVELQEKEEGEQEQVTIPANEAFWASFKSKYLEKYAALLANYLSFKRRVQLMALMPDKAAVEELQELERAHQRFVEWKNQTEASKEELKAKQTSEQSQEEQSAVEETLKQLETEIDSQKEQDLQNQQRIGELRALVTLSLDDQAREGKWATGVYEGDFIPSAQSQNCVSAIMSAMVTQIAAEHSAQESKLGDSTEPETLDELFAQFEHEVLCDNNLEEREPPEEELSTFNHIKGVLQQTINVYETFDTSTLPLQTLPAGIYDQHKEHALKISEREKEAARHLLLPGCDRHLMPKVPEKSLRLRDFENPQFYPFSTLPIEDAERSMQLKAFQQMIKSNGIDEGVAPEKRPSKLKVFERKYDEFFEPEIYRQVMQEVLLLEPDIASMYFPRTDQLMLILFNKINNAKRSSEDLTQPHATKTWRSAYRVMPDFPNWIEYFGANSVVHQVDYKPREAADAPLKFTLDEEMLPHSLLDVDDMRVQNIKQTVDQFLPDDNSVMLSELCQIGARVSRRPIVYKEKLSFGFTERTNHYLAKDQGFGLVSYKPIGQHQFWLNFADHETKLTAEAVEAVRNKRQMVEIKPPQPSAEELAAREEAAKAAAKAKKGTVEVPEEKEPESTWEEAPASWLDSLFGEQELNEFSRGTCATVTLKNGLIVRHMPNGDVVQIKAEALEQQAPRTEIDRVYLPEGVVVRHFRNLDCEALWPNGDVACFDRANEKWTVTNNKGFRREIKNGVHRDLSRVNCFSQTDASGAVTWVREDRVVMIKFEDGHLYCQHADGTRIFSQEDGNQTRIEKEGFAPVMHQATEKGADPEEWMETEELKSLDGRETLVYLPDGCVVRTLRLFKSSEEQDSHVIKHIYNRADFSCFMIDQDGDFRILTTQSRAAINDEGERARLGIDTDYLEQLFQPPGKLTPTVYYGCLSHQAERVHLETRDSERPFLYRVNSEFQLEKHVYEHFEPNQDWANAVAKFEFDQDRDIEYVGQGRNPYTSSYIFPRLFVVNPSGHALELLAQDQIDQMMKMNQSKEECLTTSRIEYIDNSQMNSIQVLHKVTSLQEHELQIQKMSKLSFPETAWPYVIPHRTEEELLQLKPVQDQYVFRNITEYSTFEPLKQNSFIDDYLRFNEWKQSQIRYDTEFGVVHVAPKDGSLDWDEIEDNEFYAKRINLKIYNERALNRRNDDLGRAVFKINFCRAYNQDSDIVSFRKRMTTVEREEQELREEFENQKREELKKRAEMERQQKEQKLGAERLKFKEHSKKKVDKKLALFAQMKQTPAFETHFHRSQAGVDYYKAHPVKPPSDEVLMRMSQRINRQQVSNEQKSQNLNQSSQGFANQPEEKNNPIVALEPEDPNQNSLVERSKKQTSLSKHSEGLGQKSKEEPEVGMSLFMQEKLYLKQLEQEKVLKAEEHHVIKTKDFDVYGKLRQEKPFVKAMQKSSAQSELNEKFITTECITDRRVKISSMANRQYINAPSVEAVRKQGQHQMILKAINKKQTFSELINEANSMVTAVLHDSHKRSVNILPSACRFGLLRVGEEAELVLSIKNEDSLNQRVQVRQTQDERLRVFQESYGPIAPGMVKKVVVAVNAKTEGRVREEIQIATKSDIFKIPVEATILSEAEFEAALAKATAETGRNGLNSRVRRRLTATIAQGRQMEEGTELQRGGESSQALDAEAEIQESPQ